MAESRQSSAPDAKRLTAIARAKRDNAAGVQAEGQFATALNKLDAQFAELDDAVRRLLPTLRQGRDRGRAGSGPDTSSRQAADPGRRHRPPDPAVPEQSLDRPRGTIKTI